MNVLIIGGSGLLGSQGAFELVKAGYQVTGLSLPPLPEGAEYPKEMKHLFQSYVDMTEEELFSLLSGFDGLVFAAGVDERVHAKRPVIDFYRKYNNIPLERILRVAGKAGVKHAVILGSYFAHFNRAWPEYEMEKHHPYIKSRVEQENIAREASKNGMDVAVLELPYIFGTQKGRKPVWVFLVKMLKAMGPVTFFPKGGTTMVTIRQVGQAIKGALEQNRGFNAYPIGWDNKTWKEMLTLFHEGMGVKDRKIVTIPTWLFRLGTVFLTLKDWFLGLQGGLFLPRFATAMAREAFIDKNLASLPLGVTEDDINKAILDSVALSVEAMKKDSRLVEMPNK